MPPNVTISKITYSSQQRTDVMLEWLVQSNGDLTGFFIERQSLRVGKSDGVPVWQKVVVDLVPSTRSYKITNLDPSGKYAFRVTAVNHRTTGHPSEVKSPANPRFKAYSAVIGAAIGGMLLATLSTVLLFIFVLRNRNNSPRLHNMIFGRYNSQSRENINLPEDEVVRGSEEEGGRGQTKPGTFIIISLLFRIPNLIILTFFRNITGPAKIGLNVQHIFP
ncbi:V-set and immunoglobulin domain-containing protein 10-like 2 [Tachysurus vachellii]|uniref:V-set and immunoglobulin domain-containing protein 10-like 2 n=1 Tax=Tachysurus vachellii TaxID=175792 RepID=UPI00296B05B7|nr:V-set and immunoglobulin domain-containing protein 10-like 2 [Tachysurus vachellii]